MEAKHRFYEEWYRGPMYDERRQNENIFVKDNKILIIEDDEVKESGQKLDAKGEWWGDGGRVGVERTYWAS